MNGMHAPISPPGAIWQEHRTPPPENRIYYYNTVTKATQWNKPEELMTSAERALEHQPWKEYELDGKKYWHNSETKESVWEMPEAFKRALGPTTPAIPVAPFAPPHGGHNSTYGGFGGGSSRDHHRDHHRDYREPIGESRQLGYGNSGQVQAFVPVNAEPDCATPEEAEAAFIKLLRQCKVQPDWTWEQTVRVIAKEPQYRAIKDPKDRKAFFAKYCNDVIVQDKERAKERLTKLRADFATMLRSHEDIKYYTRWKTARPKIEGETIFRSTDDEAERRQLFVDYILELKRANRERRAALRKSATEGLVSMLPKLNLDPYISWEDAEATIKNSPNFKLEQKYTSLNEYDIFSVFLNHIRNLEMAINQNGTREISKLRRKQRKVREAFTGLLLDLKKDGKIKAGTKWNQVRPLIENDERYKAAADLPRQTVDDACVALNIFYEIVEDEERALRGTRNTVLDLIDDKRFDITPQTTFQEFEAFINKEAPTIKIEHDILALIFERIQEKKAKRPTEDKHVDRHQRRAIEDLRSFMKRLDPPIAVSDTYEQTKTRIAQSKEFLAVNSEDDRQAAFEKHIRRLKEKEDEAERDRERRRDRDGYRGRGERPHRNVARSARSRTPEQNPYEADRRKAIAEREKNFLKSSMADALLSDRKSNDGHDRERRDHRDRNREPHRERDREHRDRDRDGHRERDREPHRERDRERDGHRERDRDFDRRPRDENHYDRERRTREEERRTREEDRERLYRRRVMDRDVDELPYGDERPSSSRRQRPAEEEDQDRKEGGRHAAKRIKTEPITTPKEIKPAAAEKPIEPSVRAGSEEGEIEED